MENYKLEIRNLQICELTTGYSLVTNVDCSLMFFLTNDGEAITGGDIESYPEGLLNIYHRFQYAEVGAGLGGFIKYLVSQQTTESPKPIVIDPANYQVMLHIMEHGANLKDFSSSRLLELMKRCKLLLDPRKVRLINRSLEDAVKEHPDLIECADIIVDNNGALASGNREGNYVLEMSMLRPGLGESRIFSNKP